MYRDNPGGVDFSPHYRYQMMILNTDGLPAFLPQTCKETLASVYHRLAVMNNGNADGRLDWAETTNRGGQFHDDRLVFAIGSFSEQNIYNFYAATMFLSAVTGHTITAYRLGATDWMVAELPQYYYHCPVALHATINVIRGIFGAGCSADDLDLSSMAGLYRSREKLNRLDYSQMYDDVIGHGAIGMLGEGNLPGYQRTFDKNWRFKRFIYEADYDGVYRRRTDREGRIRLPGTKLFYAEEPTNDPITTRDMTDLMGYPIPRYIDPARRLSNGIWS